MVIRYQGTSPKLGSCQGECPYPCNYFSFFVVGVIFLAMIPLRIRFSSSSLLTCCLRSIISMRSFPVTAKAPCTQGCCIAAGEQETLLLIFSEARGDFLIFHGIYSHQVSLHIFLHCRPKVVSVAVYRWFRCWVRHPTLPD